MTVFTRARSSSSVCSVSACEGASFPVKRAAPSFSVSQAIWIWRANAS